MKKGRESWKESDTRLAFYIDLDIVSRTKMCPCLSTGCVYAVILILYSSQLSGSFTHENTWLVCFIAKNVHANYKSNYACILKSFSHSAHSLLSHYWALLAWAPDWLEYLEKSQTKPVFKETLIRTLYWLRKPPDLVVALILPTPSCLFFSIPSCCTQSAPHGLWSRDFVYLCLSSCLYNRNLLRCKWITKVTCEKTRLYICLNVHLNTIEAISI